MSTATFGTERRRRRWRPRGDVGREGRRRLAGLALLLVALAVFGALLAGFGTGQGWWSYAGGLAGLLPAFALSVAGGVIGLWARVAHRGSHTAATLAALLGIAFAVYLGNFAVVARSVPAIHDITTDLADPPEFRRLPLRADDFAAIPKAGNRPGWEKLSPVERWKAIHADAYRDLRPIVVPMTPAQTLARAEALARSRGWRMAAADPAAGQMEATAVTSFFRFKDDVVVRVRPAGTGSRVDMRSVSRVGVSDLGENARRIRSFLSALQQ
jgi:uncharacterized protein (DUF1499 family)